MVTFDKENADLYRKICQEKNFQFTYFPARLPNFDSLLVKEEGTQKICIFEDLEDKFLLVDDEVTRKLTDFLYKSRHFNVSIFYILHSLTSLSSKSSMFTRNFLENAECLVLFKPVGNLKRTVYRFLQDYVTKHPKVTYDSILDSIFQIAEDLSGHPYIVLQPYKKVKGFMIFRIDILKENILLGNHGN